MEQLFFFFYCNTQLDDRNLNYLKIQQSAHQRLHEEYNPINFSVLNIRIYTHHVNLKGKTTAQCKLKRMDCVLSSTPVP